VIEPPATAPDGRPLAERVNESVTGADPGRSLSGNSLHFIRTIALSVGIQGPPPG